MNTILATKERETKTKDSIITDYEQKLEGSEARLRDLSNELQRLMNDPRILSQD